MNLGWEDLENIQSNHWQLKESDRILNNFHSFEIFRDDKLSLKLKITYKLVNQHFSDDYFYKEPERRAGEVYVTDGFLTLENIFDENVMLEITGITLINKNIVHNEHEIVATIMCAINNLKKSNDLGNNLGKNKFTIDWITNLNIGNYHWSSSVTEKSEKKTTRDFKSVNNTISFTENRDNFSSNSNCCNIRINDLDIFLEGQTVQTLIKNTTLDSFFIVKSVTPN